MKAQNKGHVMMVDHSLKDEFIYDWNFFLTLENEMRIISNYIDICEDNYYIHSIQLSSFVLKCCTQVERICAQISHSSQQGGLRNNLVNFANAYVEVQRIQVLLTPWRLVLQPCSIKNIHQVIDGYENIKHDKHQALKSGNLHNALLAFSILFILLSYLYRTDNPKRGKTGKSLVLPFALSPVTIKFHCSIQDGFSQIGAGPDVWDLPRLIVW